MSEELLSQKEVSLRDMQVAAVLRMLFLNQSVANQDFEDTYNQSEIYWKILVLDAQSTAIVSSVLRVNDLLKAGVTVHTLIRADRASLPDVPAVYFVEPTKENLDLIIKDLKDDKYAEFYINFTSTLERDLLEYFAENVSTTGKSERVKQVFDQYLDFVVTEPELFSLQLPNTYSLLNNPKSSEETIDTLCSTIAKGLFNVLMTTNSIPIIRAPKNGPAEMVAEKLGQLLRDYVMNTKTSSVSVLPNSDTLERSVLILLDRQIDFACMFCHSWIYQCMVFDIFKLSKNTITVQTIDKDTQLAQEKRYDLDPHDFFWSQNSHLPFPEAAENVENELTKYKEDAQEITRKTGVENIADLDPNSNADTVQIQEVVQRLPELTKRKAIIDTHVNIFSGLLEQLEDKKLDTFFEIEQDPNGTKMRASFHDILNDGKVNNLQDKMRSFIVLYLTSNVGLPKDFIQEVEEYFKKNEFDITVLKYIYKLREYMQLSSKTLQNKSLEDGTSNKASTENNLSLSSLYSLTEGRLPGTVGNLISGIKKLLPEKKTIPITNVVEAIMDPMNSSEKNLDTTDNYIYIDPKITRGSHTKKPKRQSYNKSVVFVIGGSNYLEYQNLQEWAHSQLHNWKKVMYGGTNLITPNEFLEEITALAAEN
ncbi:similar to Saccharomyces cerevisiae YDR189W SLY1 Hydrophilic protein involved in vesicle trafficking between the ER and Golgi [Maudiozyma saulgeensis]|uniref:Similar to Saccharomyces cerevisiae YDR189W SLY1 Hydrophilic protein involved in vesicle trafficking between the ER and Golgi n=1 Tax=Maudiozyma saulgeensis TaxID=1789683 RepID=A0A1X7RBE0_9SACH|nr:similar to Saccharomyces cerevisiae YDR189W SLY1 Hydrophilic protein involved in vesicle trafficking between the ER and Golgi [Kazachstania saulgeensis]